MRCWSARGCNGVRLDVPLGAPFFQSCLDCSFEVRPLFGASPGPSGLRAVPDSACWQIGYLVHHSLSSDAPPTKRSLGLYRPWARTIFQHGRVPPVNLLLIESATSICAAGRETRPRATRNWYSSTTPGRSLA